MARFFRLMLAVLVMFQWATAARAFSLLGEKKDWHVPRLGHPDGQIGGPVNIHEEHRWTVPTIYFGFTHEFQTYFGARGVAEVEKAAAEFRRLPALSTVNLDDYPLNVTRVNHRALNTGILDLKSFMMSAIIEELGLGDPTEYVYTLRHRWTPNNSTNFIVIKRNFDPATETVSSHINGELWTYTSILDGADVSITLTAPVNPLARNFPVSAFPPSGSFYTGLTRDDVGGLKHIYKALNLNVENAVTNAFSLFGGSTILGGGGSPWASPNFTNAIPTTDTGGGTTTGGGTPAANANTNYVVTALRPGIDKLDFQRIGFDGIIGAFIQTNVAFSDTFVFNGRLQTQRLGRTMDRPDLLFHAADLGDGPTADPPGIATYSRSDGFVGNGDLNGSYDPTDSQQNRSVAGPGVVNPGVTITINSLGQYFFNGPYPFNLSEASTGTSFVWGSFDGTTNAPVVYPFGSTIEELERRVLGR